jgi:hypothetical protein
LRDAAPLSRSRTQISIPCSVAAANARRLPSGEKRGW